MARTRPPGPPEHMALLDPKWAFFMATIAAMARAGGVSEVLIIAALHNAAIWDVIGGGIGGGIDPRRMSANGRAELHSLLGEILDGVMSKVKEGDVASAPMAAALGVLRAQVAK